MRCNEVYWPVSCHPLGFCLLTIIPSCAAVYVRFSKPLNQYEVCGEAADGSQTLELAAQLAPDILILDISMPPPNGLEVAAQLRHSLPDTRILLITMHDSEEMLRAAAATGASGYLLKSDAEELLMVALQRLEEGDPS